MSREYPKTENLYARDPETHISGPEWGFRMPEVGQVGRWLVLEKVDGMNMRVVYEPGAEPPDVHIYGRTDRANIPGDLRDHMGSVFDSDKLWDIFMPPSDDPAWGCDCHPVEKAPGPNEVILYGEGYGAGIQQGGHYGPEKRFILFDVRVDGKWLDWDDVVDVAEKLDIETVPVLARGVDLETAKKYVSYSCLLGHEHEKVEGIILRTDPYLFDWRGNRVMAKYKVRDL